MLTSGGRFTLVTRSITVDSLSHPFAQQTTKQQTKEITPTERKQIKEWRDDSATFKATMQVEERRAG